MNSHRQQNRIQYGFTLIELLVVIAIIGLLSSVVLASLNTARKKAQDAAIMGDLSTIQTQAAMYFDTNNKYGPTSTFGEYIVYSTTSTYPAGNVVSDTSVKAAVLDIMSKSLYPIVIAGLDPSGKKYLFAGYLPYSARWWCVDSQGYRNVSTPIYSNYTAGNCISGL